VAHVFYLNAKIRLTEMSTVHYNIHDVLTIQTTISDIPVSKDWETTANESPDIIIDEQPISFDKSKRRKVRGDFYWRNDTKSLIVERSFPVLSEAMNYKPKAELRDFNSQPKITVNKPYRRWGDFTELIQSVVQYQLLKRDLSLIYAAAGVSENGKGFLILGPSQSGKSTTLAKLAEYERFRPLGDDFVIASNNHIYSYHKPYEIRITSPLLKEDTSVFEYISRQEGEPLRKFRRQAEPVAANLRVVFDKFNLPLSANNSYSVPLDVWDTAQSMEPDVCLFLTPDSTANYCSSDKIAGKEAARRASLLNWPLRTYGLKNGLTNEFAHLDSSIEDELMISRPESILKDLVSQLDCYEIQGSKEGFHEEIASLC
jgi:hypothetical protein